MIFDVGVRTNIRKAAYFRVNDLELSAFVRKVQDDGNYVFSVIPLFRPKMKDVVERHIIDNGYGECSIFKKDIDPRLIRTEHTNDDFDGF